MVFLIPSYKAVLLLLGNGELFGDMYEAQVLTKRWVEYYNRVRPHSNIGGRPPAPQSIIPISV